VQQRGGRLGFRQLSDWVEGLLSVLTSEAADPSGAGSAAVLDLALQPRMIQEVWISIPTEDLCHL